MPEGRPKRVALLLSLFSVHGVALGRTLQYGRSRGWVMHIAPHHTGGAGGLAGWRPDGVLARVIAPEQERHLRSLGVPVVNLSGYAADVTFPRVANDDRAGGAMAADHFIDRGLQRATYLGVESVLASRRRAAGFSERFAQRLGVEVSRLMMPPLAPSADTWAADHEQLGAALRTLPRPTGLFAFNDDVALRVLEAAYDAGVEVPEELAVLGFDNTPPVCDHALPPLSSVEQDAEALGLLAAQTLDRLMAGESVPPEQLVPPRRVVQRASTDVIAVDDDLVRTVLRRIRDEATAGLTVADVLRGISCSRRPFEKRFRRAVGRSPLEEIHRQRIAQARHLLTETDQSITAIALDCGFTDVSRFGRVFRKFTGTTARTYREAGGCP